MDLFNLTKQFGVVTDVRVVLDKTGKSKGYAYVDFETEEAAQAALKLHETQLNGRTLKVTISCPPDKKQRQALRY